MREKAKRSHLWALPKQQCPGCSKPVLLQVNESERNATMEAILANCSIRGDIRTPAEEFWKWATFNDFFALENSDVCRRFSLRRPCMSYKVYDWQEQLNTCTSSYLYWKVAEHHSYSRHSVAQMRLKSASFYSFVMFGVALFLVYNARTCRSTCHGYQEFVFLLHKAFLSTATNEFQTFQLCNLPSPLHLWPPRNASALVMYFFIQTFIATIDILYRVKLCQSMRQKLLLKMKIKKTGSIWDQNFLKQGFTADSPSSNSVFLKLEVSQILNLAIERCITFSCSSF